MNTNLSPRLLICDPCPDNRSALAFFATRDGCEVHQASTPTETLLLNHIVRPDVLLIEVMMPQAPAGYCLIDDVRRGGNCPEIIVVTGYQTEEHLEQCGRFGVAHVLKPYRADALLAFVKYLTAERRRRASMAATEAARSPGNLVAFERAR